MSDEIERRYSPYIWPTWISGLLSGDKHCWYAPWFKAHHFKYPKIEKDAERLKVWKSDHAVFVAKVVRELTDAGWSCTVEDQNKIRLKGETSTVGGCPDIVAEQPGLDVALVVDCKTGRRRDSDYWQVMEYIALLTLKKGRLHGKAVTGHVRYLDGVVFVHPEPKPVERVYATIRVVASSVMPPTVPSAAECARCDIACCTDRIETASESEEEVEVDEF